MAKKRKQYAQTDDNGKVLSSTQVIETETGRGTVRDNALKAVVTSSLFRTRVVKSKKGKGSFVRKDKHKGRESYSMAA